MPFYSFEMILVGIILLGAMTAGGIKLWINRRKDIAESVDLSNLSESNKNQ